jgi:hypothetical protein
VESSRMVRFVANPRGNYCYLWFILGTIGCCGEKQTYTLFEPGETFLQIVGGRLGLVVLFLISVLNSDGLQSFPRYCLRVILSHRVVLFCLFCDRWFFAAGSFCGLRTDYSLTCAKQSQMMADFTAFDFGHHVVCCLDLLWPIFRFTCIFRGSLLIDLCNQCVVLCSSAGSTSGSIPQVLAYRHVITHCL